MSLSETGSDFSDFTTDFSSSTTLSVTDVERNPNPHRVTRYSRLKEDEEKAKSRFLNVPRKAQRLRKSRSRKKMENFQMVAPKKIRTLSCGTLTFHWAQKYELDSLKIKVKLYFFFKQIPDQKFFFQVSHVEMGPEFVGYFVKFQLSLGEIGQEIEAHFEDLANVEFMRIFNELYSSGKTDPILHFRAQNLRRTLTYVGKLDLLRSEEGTFTQIVNLFLKHVSTFSQ